MASHFARWTLAQNRVRVHRLPIKLVQLSMALTETRRRRYLAARALLAEMMLRIYGISQLPDITVTASGRPHFTRPDLPDFSIAYAGNIIGVLIAEEGRRAGLDMEIVRAHSRQTLKQHSDSFSSGEKAWINARRQRQFSG